MQVDAAEVFTPTTAFGRRRLVIDHSTGRLLASDPLPSGRSATGRAVPGFVDLQLNGAFGKDFSRRPECLWEVAAELPRLGITAFLPTIITAPLTTYERALGVLAEGPPPGFRGAVPLGFHFEGPFLAPAKRGAHEERHLRLPDLDAAAGWTRARGVRLVTLAPELPGALDLVAALTARGTIVSAGHSEATYEQACEAIAAGVSMVTHLFNAMSPHHHREPGLVGAALEHDGIRAGIIPDGLHVHPAVLKTVARAKGGDLLTVTDAMAALGAGEGSFELAGQRVVVKDGRATLEDGTLAGSVLSMTEALRNLVERVGMSFCEALTTCTLTPARLLGESERGELRPGARADIVLLNDEGEVSRTFVGGRCVYEA